MPPAPPADPVPASARPSHVLRPHHVFLLYIFMHGFYAADDEEEENPFPKAFTLALHRLMIREVAEVTPPRSYQAILADIKQAALTADCGPVEDLIVKLGRVGALFATADTLSNFMQALPILFLDRDDEETARFSRRSLFGYFCHRCFVSFTKLAIGGIEKLHQGFIAWVHAGDSPITATTPGYAQVRRDVITNDYQLFKTKQDKTEYADAETYTLFMKGLTTGDSNVANEGLRRFFEQKFHDNSESGLRQHAMLNLARMYFLRRELAACRKTLEEAITASRTAGDNKTLQHCSSLMHRLPPLERGRRPIINEVQPDMHPLEILADVRKLINVQYQQPLSAAFERIVEAIGLYDHYVDVQGGQFIESEQLAQHAVQSIVWGTFGCSKLARIEEDIVTAFSEVGGDDNTRLTVTLNRAYHMARQGKYEESVASLLEPDVWRGLNIADYNLWAAEIWNILALRACRHRKQRQLKEYLMPRRPNTPHSPRDYQWAKEPIGSIIRDPLHEVMLMRMCEQSYASVDQLLTALWHAEYHGRYNLYRTAIILLADVGLEFGMTKWCKRLLDEVMPQIMSEDDREQKAFAQYTLARCIIASGDSSQAALEEAVPLLESAEGAYATIQMFAAECDVLYLLSVVLHNLGNQERRDAMARKHEIAMEMREYCHLEIIEPWVEDVWAIVTDVGAAIASR
ncbi:hypothetical protein K466DRAFT_595244 [Polyporus arcularius HHB13444]|uniref:Anaphase-promoting complex subunit 5 n=1 Tax=Polyporus arcularius HHB13444 TaxID=1314778 RepID=A0A5C3Q1T0_9APHY|nr:hypothetical protein K466DRAFT_595244 [Polyporus arcularius HHB13444]